MGTLLKLKIGRLLTSMYISYKSDESDDVPDDEAPDASPRFLL